MSRAVWTGHLGFGLVNIPVALHRATQPKDVRFHLVDRETGRRVRYRRVVEAPDEAMEREDASESGVGRPPEKIAPQERKGLREVEVRYQDLLRGYEIDQESLVLLEPEEIERVRPRRSHSIEIEDFVDLADIDPVFFEETYHVAPGTGAERPYVLLLRAMQAKGRAGIGRFVLRTKPHLVAVRPRDGILCLETLFFGDEVRDPAELTRGLEGVFVDEREQKLAEQLIEMLASEWNPAAYSDTYREELLRLIAERRPSEAQEPPETASSDVERLMEALRASVADAKEPSGSPPPKGEEQAG